MFYRVLYTTLATFQSSVITITSFLCFSFIFHWVAKRRKVSKEKKANFKFFRPYCNVSKHVFEDFTEAFVTFYVVYQTDFKRN